MATIMNGVSFMGFFPAPTTHVVLGFHLLPRHNPGINSRKQIESWNTDWLSVFELLSPSKRKGPSDKLYPEFPHFIMIWLQQSEKRKALFLQTDQTIVLLICFLELSYLWADFINCLAQNENLSSAILIIFQASGIIRPSVSPVGAGFFFVGKKMTRTNILYLLWTLCWNIYIQLKSSQDCVSVMLITLFASVKVIHRRPHTKPFSFWIFCYALWTH